jgi:hypothetical protein
VLSIALDCPLLPSALCCTDEDEDDEDLLPPVAEQFVKDCAAALKACPPGKAAIYLGGEALLDASTAAGESHA